MRPITIYLARLIGLYTLIVSVWLVIERGPAMAQVQAVITQPTALFILGLAVLGPGLAVVVGHNIWSGGVAPVLITLIGWLLVLRGLALIFVPAPVFAGVVAAIHYQSLSYLYAAIPFALGAYLTYAGFTAQQRA